MLDDVAKALKAAKGRVLVLTHHNADIDAVSSALALQSCLLGSGRQVKVGVSESVSKAAAKLAAGREVLVDPDCRDFDFIAVVDTSSPEQLSSVRNLRVDVLIDHHSPGKLVGQAKASYVDEDARSSAQLVLQVMEKLCPACVGRENAFLLAAGVVADTAHLRLARVEELEILVQLLRKGVKLEEVLASVETPQEMSERIACLKAANRAGIYRIGSLYVAFSGVGSHEAAACRCLVKLGADIAVVAAEKKEELRISSRGRKEILERGIDLAEIFKGVGEIIGGTGGGHNLAGSANGRNTKAREKAFSFILKELERRLGKSASKLG